MQAGKRQTGLYQPSPLDAGGERAVRGCGVVAPQQERARARPAQQDIGAGWLPQRQDVVRIQRAAPATNQLSQMRM